MQTESEQQASSRSQSFPSDKVFAVFESERAAAQASQRLQAAGAAESDIAILTGEAAARELDPSSERHGFLERAAHELSDVSTYLENYAQSARKGKSVLIAGYRNDEDRQAMTALLLDSGAADVSYASGWTFTAVVQSDREA